MLSPGSRSARSARVLLLFGAMALVAALPAGSQGIPARLSDEQFWKMVTDFSDEDGYFRSDNFVSNEVSFQHVIPDLVRGRVPGGVYLGVGPDQNFTYIAAMRPRIAFIVDIRREAVLQHLMYKAIFEMSRERADFLAMLFSRPRPARLASTAAPAELFQAYYAVSADSTLYWKNLRAITDRLTRHHGFGLSPDDLSHIEYIYTSFYLAGPDITYNYGSGRGGGRGMPTYSQLMLETDGQGTNRAYMASEELYGIVREMQINNLIVPVVGDFGKTKALRAVGQYLRDHRATVTAIYTSNVEQYLFQDPDKWKTYYANVATFPIDSTSTFIRAAFNGMGFRSMNAYGMRSLTMLCPVAEQIRAFNEGRVTNYQDVLCAFR